MTSRTYGQYCPVAHALDVVGERWTLLIARELLLMGARRFTDLSAALPGLGTGLLAQRLKQLEGHGLIRRERLTPPAASTVYVLTESGRRLGPIVAALAAFGAESLGEPDEPGDVDVGRFVRLAAAGAGQALAAGQPVPRIELHVGDRVVHLPPPGDGPAPGGADLVITIGAGHLPGLALARRSLTALIEAGHARAEGDAASIAYATRLFATFSLDPA